MRNHFEELVRECADCGGEIDPVASMGGMQEGGHVVGLFKRRLICTPCWLVPRIPPMRELKTWSDVLRRFVTREELNGSSV